MAYRVQRVRHAAAAADVFTGLPGEITVNTTTNSLRVHDGVNPGGYETARRDLSNVAQATASNDGKMSAAQAARVITAVVQADIGVLVQPFNAYLVAFTAELTDTTAANRMFYTSGDGAYADTALTDFARTILDDADAGTVRSTLGLVIGTNVQAYDAGLQSIAGLTTAAGNLIYTTAADTYAVVPSTSFGRSLLNYTDLTELAVALDLDSLGNLALLDTINNANWSGTDLAIANGGTGASTAGDALTNLGAAASSITLSGGAGMVTTIGNLTANRSIVMGTPGDVTASSTSATSTSSHTHALANNAVTTDKIANLNVTGAKIAAETITGAKLPFNTLDVRHLDLSGTYFGSAPLADAGTFELSIRGYWTIFMDGGSTRNGQVTLQQCIGGSTYRVVHTFTDLDNHEPIYTIFSAGIAPNNVGSLRIVHSGAGSGTIDMAYLRIA